MHASIRPNLGPLFGVAETELAQKANPEGINQYTKGGGSGEEDKGKPKAKSTSTPSGKGPAIKPAFSGKAKVTIQSAGEALAKQGLTLGKPTMGKDFKASYPVTDKNGNTTTMTAVELTKALTGKAKKAEFDLALCAALAPST